MRRLYRSGEDRIVAGVCGGLGRYVGVDPVLLRLAWVVLILFSFGFALIVYVVAALIIPSDTTGQQLAGSADYKSRRVLGWLLVGTGVIFLLNRLVNWSHLVRSIPYLSRLISTGAIWGLVLIVLGLFLIVRRRG